MEVFYFLIRSIENTTHVKEIAKIAGIYKLCGRNQNLYIKDCKVWYLHRKVRGFPRKVWGLPRKGRGLSYRNLIAKCENAKCGVYV